MRRRSLSWCWQIRTIELLLCWRFDTVRIPSFLTLWRLLIMEPHFSFIRCMWTHACISAMSSCFMLWGWSCIELRLDFMWIRWVFKLNHCLCVAVLSRSWSSWLSRLQNWRLLQLLLNFFIYVPSEHYFFLLSLADFFFKLYQFLLCRFYQSLCYRCSVIRSFDFKGIILFSFLSFVWKSRRKLLTWLWLPKLLLLNSITMRCLNFPLIERHFRVEITIQIFTCILLLSTFILELFFSFPWLLALMLKFFMHFSNLLIFLKQLFSWTYLLRLQFIKKLLCLSSLPFASNNHFFC